MIETAKNTLELKQEVTVTKGHEPLKGHEPPEKDFNKPKPADLGPLPRIIQSLERAVEGTKRVKMYTRKRDVLYVLVATGKEEEAKKFYKDKTGVDPTSTKVLAD